MGARAASQLTACNRCQRTHLQDEQDDHGQHLASIPSSPLTGVGGKASHFDLFSRPLTARKNLTMHSPPPPSLPIRSPPLPCLSYAGGDVRLELCLVRARHMSVKTLLHPVHHRKLTGPSRVRQRLQGLYNHIGERRVLDTDRLLPSTANATAT